jgi:hypothetical protein
MLLRELKVSDTHRANTVQSTVDERTKGAVEWDNTGAVTHLGRLEAFCHKHVLHNQLAVWHNHSDRSEQSLEGLRKLSTANVSGVHRDKCTSTLFKRHLHTVCGNETPLHTPGQAFSAKRMQQCEIRFSAHDTSIYSKCPEILAMKETADLDTWQRDKSAVQRGTRAYVCDGRDSGPGLVSVFKAAPWEKRLFLLWVCDTLVLNRAHRQHFRHKTVELIEAPPGPRSSQPLEDVTHGAVVHLWSTVEHIDGLA